MTLRQVVLPARHKARAPADIRKARKPFKLTVKALRDGYEMVIYGDISVDGGSALAFREELMRAGGDPVTLLINSDGGDIFEGLAIYNEMLAYPGEITARIMSMAGSAASIIAMGADRIEMAPNAQMMVHQAWVGLQGNADDLRAVIPTLEQIDTSLVDIYAARTGQPREAIEELVKAETYLTAQRCVELGFADGFIASAKVRPLAKRNPDASAKFAAVRRRAALSRLAALARSASASR